MSMSLSTDLNTVLSSSLDLDFVVNGVRSPVRLLRD